MSTNSTGYGPSHYRNRIFFDGDANNFAIWQTRFTSFLYTLDEGVHTALLPKVESKADATDFNKKNMRAYAELAQVLDEKSLQLIMRDAPNDGRLAYKILCNHYASTEKPRVLTLYEQLTTVKMTESEDITDYLIRSENYAAGLRSAGETISDNLIIAMIMKGLPPSYQPFVVVHTQLDKNQTFTEFKAALTNFDHSESARCSQSSAMASTSRVPNKKPSYYRPAHPHSSSMNTGGQCMACGGKNHNTRDCRSKSRLNCGYCKINGHLESVCLKKKRDNTGNGYNRPSNSANSSYAFLLNHCNNIQSQKREPDTFSLMVDCGATSHLINNSERFVSYDKTFQPDKHFIELADGHQSNQLVVAKGTAEYTILDDNDIPQHILLENALLAPTMPTSLFSVHAATLNGACVTFSKEGNMLRSGKTQFPIRAAGRLYFLHTSPGTQDSINLTKSLSEWHRTLGHMNNSDIVELEKISKGMQISGSKQPTNCHTCDESKITKQSHKEDEKATLAKKPLQRVHSDICGPITPTSKQGHNYIINFIDEYSSMLFIYTIRNKSDAIIAIKQFIADTAPIGNIKELHTDNGQEYMGHDFQTVLRNKGIKHTTTAPYSSYQNGKSERNWRSLMEMTRCLLKDSNLPKTFWGFAAKHAQYLKNRSYQRRTKKTAYRCLQAPNQI